MFRQTISFLVSVALILNQTLYAASLELDKAALQKSTLDAAANGVPIVNITTPNASGLSHNKFTTYNVEQKGLILNNANNVVQTQLGGYIASNPNLSGSQSAKTILNEVTGSSRSLLNGFTEVAGNQADIIVANPNGISINGGGFINAPKVTLTTGTPTLLNAQVSDYDVIGGDILIEGNGFNAAANSQVDLYSKVLTLNAKLYAQSLNIVTGENQISADGTVTSKHAVGTGVSLDSSALGGIYAQKITLVGTDKGVGVNLPPEVLASNGHIDITADGKISFQKTTASDSVHAVSTSGDIVVNKAVSASTDITLQAQKSIINTDVITAGLLSDERKNTASTLTLQAKNIINQNQMSAYGTLLLNAQESITNTGILYAPNVKPITTKVLNNTGTLLSERVFTLNISDTLINDGIIRSDDTLSIRTASLVNHSKINTDATLLIDAYTLNNTGYITADTLTITANDFINSGALLSVQDISLNTQDTLSNSGTINSGNHLTLKSNGALTNTNSIVAGLRTDNTLNSAALMSVIAHSIFNKGSIITYGDLALNTDTLENQDYLYSANYFVATMNQLTNTGTFNSNDSLKLSVAHNALNQGTINAAKSLTLEIGESLTNSASIVAGFLPDNTFNTDATLSIKANTLTNQSKIDSQGALSIETTALTNSADGYINANNDLHVNADQLSNAGTIFSNQHLSLALENDFINNGSINGAKSVDLRLSGGFTNNGVFISGFNRDGTYNTDASIAVQASFITNTGKLSSYGSLYLDTLAFSNLNYASAFNWSDLHVKSFYNSGYLLSDTDFSLIADDGMSNTGVLNAGSTMTLKTNGLMSNTGTIVAGIASDNTYNTHALLHLESSSLTNSYKISSMGELSINTHSFTNQGYLNASHGLDILATTLRNSGTVYSDTYLILNLEGIFNNEGTFNGGKSVLVTTPGDIVNTSILSAGFLLDNTYTPDATLSIKANTLTNQSKIDSQGALSIETTALTNSADGYINANNDLHVNADQLSNAGTIFSNQHLSLALENDFINNGSINGAKSVDLRLSGGFTNNGVFISGFNRDGTYNTDASIAVQASFITNTGKISSQKDLYLTTPLFTNYNYVYTADLLNILANTTNNKGTLFSNNDLTLSSTNAITNDGLINGANRVTLSTNGALTNNGTLSAGLYKDGTFNTNANLSIQALSLSNNQLNSQGDLFIQTTAFENKSYTRASNTFSVQADTLTNAGILYSNAYLTLTLTNALMNTGTISGGNALDITANTQITNDNTLVAGLYDNGTFNTDATLTLQTPSIINNAKITSYGSSNTQTSTLSNLGSFNTKTDLSITTDTLTNTGTLFSDHDVALLINSAFTNDGTINGANQLDIRTNGGLTNNGILSAGLYANGATNENATLSILHSSAITNHSKINSYGRTSLATAIFSNDNYLYSKALGLTTNSLTNTGTLLSDSIFTLSINSDFTNEGTINSAKTLDLNINGTLINNGTLSAGLYKDGTSNLNANLAIQASSITNNSKVRSLGDMVVTAPHTITNQGYLSALNGLHVNTATLNNYGVLFSGVDMNLWVSDLLYNYENANILALGNMTMAKDATLGKTKHIVNDKATIETINGDIGIYAEAFENKTDGIEKATKDISSQMLSLSQGSAVLASLVDEAKQELFLEGKYQVLQGTEMTQYGEPNFWGDDDAEIEVEKRYNGISEQWVHVVSSSVTTWDSENEDGNVIHHSKTLYDIRYVSMEDVQTRLNEKLAKFDLSSVYKNTLTYDGILSHFYYVIPDVKGGETERKVTVTTQQEYLVSQSTPAKLFSGGKLSIQADTISNYLSQISSNDDMLLVGNSLDNHGEVLFEINTKTGQYRYCYKQCHSHWHSPDYTWGDLPSSTAYAQSNTVYSTIYSAKSIIGNLATVNNIDIKSDQAPLGHSATTTVTPSVSIAPVSVNVAAPQASTTIAPMSSIPVDSAKVGVSTTQPDAISITPIGTTAVDSAKVSVSTTQPDATAIASPTKPMIDPTTHDVSISLPKGDKGLFVVSTDPKSHYVVETNPAFAVLGNFLGSEYLLSRLGVNPNATLKRLGDNFYENQLVRDSVFAQTGKRYLNENITSDTAQYRYLMDNALSAKEELHLTPYVRLSAEQIAALTKDIVWMESREVDGRQVLVPVVYIADAALKTTDNGAKIIAAKDVILQSDTLTNQGEIRAGDNVVIATASDLSNQGGSIRAGETLALRSNGDIYNISSDLSARIISITADSFLSDMDSQNLTQNYARMSTQNSQLLSDMSTLNAINSISIQTKNNLSLIGTTLNAGGALALFSQEGDIAIASKTHEDRFDFNILGGYNKGESVAHLASSLNAENISINANQVNVIASDLTAKKDIVLQGKEGVSILAENDLEYTESKLKTKGSFGSKKTTIDMSHKESVVQSTLNANNILIKADTGSATLESANLIAKENIVVDAKTDINVLAKQYREGEMHSVTKSSFGGLKQSASMNRVDALNAKEAALRTEALNIIMKSGNDIKVIGSNIDAASDLQLQAANEVLIAAAQELSQSEQWSKKSSFNLGNMLASIATLGLAKTGPVYEMEFKKDDKTAVTAKSSNINSGNNITINSGSAKVVGSNVNAEKNIQATTSTGSIEVLSAEESAKTSSEHKKTEVSLGSILDVAKDIAPSLGDAKLKLTLAEATYDENAKTTDSLTHKSSSITSKSGDIVMDSKKDITIDGSTLNAAKTVKLTTQEGDITIKESIDAYSENSKDKHASAKISLTVQNEYVEIASAVKAAADSAEQLKKVKDDYSNYKGEVSKLESTLSDLKARYKAKEAGIDPEDISDLADLIDNVKDTEKYYVAAIAAATVDLASKTTAIASQTATAAASSATYGFSAGIALDVKGSQLVADNLQTKSLASSIYGNDIIVKTNTAKETTTAISGSNVVADNDLNIQTHDLHVKSSTDTTTSKQDSKDLSGTLSMTMYGGGSGMGATLGYGQGHQNSDSTTNTNSNLIAKNIDITTSNDASFKGATVQADDTLNLKVGGDLSVESQRDSSSSNSKGFNVSVSGSLGNDKDYTSNSKAGQNALNNSVGARVGDGLGSTGASYGASTGTSQSKQTVLTSLTGENVTIDVENNTHVKGALIAAGKTNEQGQFEDNGKLNLSTGTLTFANSTNSQYSSSNSYNVGTNIGYTTGKNTQTNVEETTGKVNSSSLSLSNEMGYSSSKTLATVGEGTLHVKDTENSDDLERLNRDTSKVNKELYAGNVGTSVTATLDHRLLTEDGRKQIAEDVATTITEIYAVSQVASAYLSDSSKEILKDKLANKQLTAEQEKQLTNELNALKKIVNEQGYDIDKMSNADKITTLEKLNANTEPLTTKQKQLRDVIWLSGTLLSDDWNAMRKQQIDTVADSSVKSLDFWRTEAKWNEMTQDEKEAFAQNYNDGNNKIVGNTLKTDVKITDLDGAGILNSEGKIIRNTQGDYSQDGSLIRLDTYDTKNFYTVLNVILHEGTGHGYQDYAIKNQSDYVKAHPLQADDIRLLTLAYITKMWPGKNIEYSKDLTYWLYRNGDPSEVDAWKVGDTTSVIIQRNKPKEAPKEKQ